MSLLKVEFQLRTTEQLASAETVHGKVGGLPFSRTRGPGTCSRWTTVLMLPYVCPKGRGLCLWAVAYLRARAGLVTRR